MSEKNPFPGENNTGHIWDDDIRELDNPPPKWWMTLFWVSIASTIIYGVLYPTWPLVSSYTSGLFGWTQIEEYKQRLSAIEEVRAVHEAKLEGKSAEEILQSEELTAYAQRSAKFLFGENCAGCHGSGGQGNVGYPVLIDDDWLYGGKVQTLVQTISNGRKAFMMSHGRVFKDEKNLDSIAESIAVGETIKNPLYMSKGCFACHGVDAKGIQPMGSANLADSVMRFRAEPEQSDKDSVKYTIQHGVNDSSDPMTREAIMPAFKDRLSEMEIKKLAVYVYKLSN